MINSPLLIILGATASGKTKLAVALAQALNGAIISADSRQVFRGMDVGTGKDLTEYEVNGQRIAHHLINIRDAGENYNVDAFKDDFYTAFAEISQRNQLPILCGGTGMYIHSLLQNHALTSIPVDQAMRERLMTLSKPQLCELLATYPEQHRAQVDVSSEKRLIRGIEIAEYLRFNALPEKNNVEFEAVIIGLRNEISVQRAKILTRLEMRLNAGLIEEVQTLLEKGVTSEMLTFYGLEYKFAIAYLSGTLNYATFKERLGTAICQFAKRQQTFFRKMEKDGVKINWLDANQDFMTLQESAMKLISHEFEIK
jgi:tRNA dimethylallyltransferase